MELTVSTHNPQKEKSSVNQNNQDRVHEGNKTSLLEDRMSLGWREAENDISNERGNRSRGVAQKKTTSDSTGSEISLLRAEGAS